MPESLAAKKSRTHEILQILARTYPAPKCALNHKNPYELLIATILSAQCTDARVNIVTPALFEKYPGPKELALSHPRDVEKLIQSAGFYRAKTKSIRSAAADIVAKHHGDVPQTMDELTALRGVGRKTANVVLGNAFGQNVGVVVDTHVSRLSFRLNLTRHTDPVKIEQDLMKLVPQNEWTNFSHRLIFHGRQICTARRPNCPACPLLPLCPTGPKLIKQGLVAKPTAPPEN
jgi:endonuclease-3